MATVKGGRVAVIGASGYGGLQTIRLLQGHPGLHDENQRVQARVTDTETGISKEIQIEYSGEGVLSESDIERKASYLKKLRIE